jgi:RNA polymerase sigma factor (sigma-70 family)
MFKQMQALEAGRDRSARGNFSRGCGHSTDMPRAESEIFEQLYDLHARELLHYCFRRTGDAAGAEDMVAVVFMEAWRKRSQLQAPTARAWLYGIATNVAHNHRRAARRYEQTLGRLAQVRPPSPAEAAEAEEAMREILTQLRRLPRRELDVLGLCLWSGLSYEEAAVALGLPVGTVRSRLSRARTRLQSWSSAPPSVLPQAVPESSKGAA